MTPKEKAAFVVDESRCMRAMQCAPAGGNANNTEFTVIDDKDRMAQIRAVAYARMEEAAARGVQKGGHKVHRWTDVSKGQLPLL